MNGKLFEVKVSCKGTEGWLQIVAVNKSKRKGKDDSNYGLNLFFNRKKLADFIVCSTYRENSVSGSFTYIKDLSYQLFASNSVIEIYQVNKKADNLLHTTFSKEFEELIETLIVEKITLYNETAYNLQTVIKNAFLNPYISESDDLVLHEIPKDIEKEIII